MFGNSLILIYLLNKYKSEDFQSFQRSCGFHSSLRVPKKVSLTSGINNFSAQWEQIVRNAKTATVLYVFTEWMFAYLAILTLRMLRVPSPNSCFHHSVFTLNIPPLASQIIPHRMTQCTAKAVLHILTSLFHVVAFSLASFPNDVFLLRTREGKIIKIQKN